MVPMKAPQVQPFHGRKPIYNNGVDFHALSQEASSHTSQSPIASLFILTRPESMLSGEAISCTPLSPITSTFTLTRPESTPRTLSGEASYRDGIIRQCRSPIIPRMLPRRSSSSNTLSAPAFLSCMASWLRSELLCTAGHGDPHDHNGDNTPSQEQYLLIVAACNTSFPSQ